MKSTIDAEAVFNIAMNIPVAEAVAGCCSNINKAGDTTKAEPTPNPDYKNPDMKPIRPNLKIEGMVISISPLTKV